MNSSSRVQTSRTGAPAAFGEARGFDGSFAGVLAAVAAAHVGVNDADLSGSDVEGGDEFVLDAERALGSGPDGELAGRVPLGDGGAGFERCVRDVLDGVGLGEFDGVGRCRDCGRGRLRGRVGT